MIVELALIKPDGEMVLAARMPLSVLPEAGHTFDLEPEPGKTIVLKAIEAPRWVFRNNPDGGGTTTKVIVACTQIEFHEEVNDEQGSPPEMSDLQPS